MPPFDPPGWSYNPSSWSQRIPIVILALVGCAIASYLAAYQMRLIDDVWEPFFGGGSRKILNSWVSELFPVSDAAIGAVAYLIDAVAGVVGGRTRWRTMPWMVILFGVAVGPLGIVGIVLIVIQPLLFDAWCTLCIASAAVSLLMIYPAMDEVVASWQYMKRGRAKGHSGWELFWRGGPAL